MKRTLFGSVAARLSPKTDEGAIILSHDTAQHLRARLQWMRADEHCADLARALKWIEQNAGEHCKKSETIEKRQQRA